MRRTIITLAIVALTSFTLSAQERITLDSKPFHDGTASWKMTTISGCSASGEQISSAAFDDSGWMEAIVPGTVLGTLVHNGVYPEPYYGLNNKIESGIIPDLAKVGRDIFPSSKFISCGLTIV